MDFKGKINTEKLPLHIAVIMDGNGRWAKQHGKNRVFGHKQGVKAVREITEGAAGIGIRYLTLYAFSTENWNRPSLEVTALMELLVSTIKAETKTLMKNNIRLRAIGNLSSLPGRCQKSLHQTIEATAGNTRMDLVLALSYSSRWEILEATRKIAEKAADGLLSPDQISESVFEQHLTTSGIPDPELLIRTSGENRISNFLLWQIAYTELYFTPVLWPDFTRQTLYEAILDYQQRERRFGLISEQVNR